MAKYVKLGAKAQTGSFFDPLSKLSLVPGQVAEVPKEAKKSKVYKDALSNNHIVEADEDEYEEYMEGKQASEKDMKEKSKTSKKVETQEEPEDDDDETDPDEDDDDEDDVDTMTKSELVDALKDSDLSEDIKKGLNKLNKEELKELYRKQSNA